MHALLNIPAILQALQSSAIAGAVAGDAPEYQWLFPIIETCHVLTVATVFGSIFMVDMRLLGLAERGSAVSRLSSEILPYTWSAFILSALFGSLLFTSKAEQYFYNLQFRLKFLFMALAGVNMLIFQLGVYRKVRDWDQQWPPPAAARAAGALSLTLWIAVIFMGRWIGFATN